MRIFFFWSLAGVYYHWKDRRLYTHINITIWREKKWIYIVCIARPIECDARGAGTEITTAVNVDIMAMRWVHDLSGRVTESEIHSERESEEDRDNREATVFFFQNKNGHPYVEILIIMDDRSSASIVSFNCTAGEPMPQLKFLLVYLCIYCRWAIECSH